MPPREIQFPADFPRLDAQPGPQEIPGTRFDEVRRNLIPRDPTREAYNPWVSLAEAAAAEALVKEATRIARNKGGNEGSFYLSMRDPADDPVQPVDETAASPSIQASTTYVEDNQRNTMFQQMIHRRTQETIPETTPTPVQPVLERVLPTPPIYPNPLTTGRLFDRRG